MDVATTFIRRFYTVHSELIGKSFEEAEFGQTLLRVLLHLHLLYMQHRLTITTVSHCSFFNKRLHFVRSYIPRRLLTLVLPVVW